MDVCPCCNNETLETGEYVDFFQVTPDRCDNCGYIQQSPNPEYNETYETLPITFYAKCWELLISPYPEYL